MVVDVYIIGYIMLWVVVYIIGHITEYIIWGPTQELIE
jgi:hypothetical protein